MRKDPARLCTLEVSNALEQLKNDFHIQHDDAS